MTRFAWATDIHLNSVEPPVLEAFCAEVKAAEVEGIFLTGDIAEAASVIHWLTRLHSQLQLPIYFVLGNHDYYGSSVGEVRDAMHALQNPELIYLPAGGPVRLSPEVTLVGHGGWGDCRIGDLENFVDLMDYLAIDDLRNTLDLRAIRRGVMDKRRLCAKLQSLGDEAAATLSPQLEEAAAGGGSVVVMNHVSPFREACWYDGSISDPPFLPGFTCKAIGDLLARVASEESKTLFVVLCGHTHGHGHAEILPNLEVHTGFGNYGGLYPGFVDIDGGRVSVRRPSPPSTRDS